MKWVICFLFSNEEGVKSLTPSPLEKSVQMTHFIRKNKHGAFSVLNGFEARASFDILKNICNRLNRA